VGPTFQIETVLEVEYCKAYRLLHDMVNNCLGFVMVKSGEFFLEFLFAPDVVLEKTSVVA
jgi:hypothetical protein